MSSHDDKVIHTEFLPRACGCVQEFNHYDRDPYRKERREKFGRTRCPPCGQKANAEHNARQEAGRPDGKIRKGEEIKRVPLGALIQLERQEDGSWHGSLSFDGYEVEAFGGAMGVVNKLARKWLQSSGQRVTGQVKE